MAAMAVKESKESKYKTVSISDEFNCKAEDLFQAICNEDRVRAYTQSDCKIDPKACLTFFPVAMYMPR